MNLNDLPNILAATAQLDCVDCVSLYFITKDKKAFQPELAPGLQKQLIQLVLPTLTDSINRNALVPYSPIGCADGEIEAITSGTVPGVNGFQETIADDRLYRRMSDLKVGSISYYCVKVFYSGETVYLFRWFQKMAKLRKGLLTCLVSNELRMMESEFLGLDSGVDLVLWGDEILILNHIGLERIFQYKDVFAEKTVEAMRIISERNVFANMDRFAEDCQNDVRIMKRFTQIIAKNSLLLFFDNYSKVPDIVQALDLDIEFDDQKKLIYRDRSQLQQIAHLLSDDYFRTLLSERTGVAKMEGVL